MRGELPKYGGIFVQAEDELGAVSMALGMSYSGLARRHRQRRPRHFAEDRSHRLGLHGRDAAHHYVMCNAADPAPVCRPTSSKATCTRPSTAATATARASCSRATTVEDCFYIAIEAARIARKYSTPVFILSDTSLATRIEAFDEPDLAKIMLDPKPDLTPRQTHKPYPLDEITQHVPPGTRILDGKYPLMSGLEHDEMGHPTGSPKLHMAMTAKRRNKLRKLAEEIPVPEIYGDQEGDTLLVGWGSTYGPIHDAVKRAREARRKDRLRSICGICIRCRTAWKKSLPEFKRIVVVEMNDQGIYGFGQLATILRARYCDPKIESFTKTDGLTFRVKEILEGVFQGRSFAARIYPATKALPSFITDTAAGERENNKRSRPAGSRLRPTLKSRYPNDEMSKKLQMTKRPNNPVNATSLHYDAHVRR